MVGIFNSEFVEPWFHTCPGQQYLHWQLVWHISDAGVYLAFSESARDLSKCNLSEFGCCMIFVVRCQNHSLIFLGWLRQISGRGAINLAHRQHKWTPAMQTCANLSDVRRWVDPFLNPNLWVQNITIAIIWKCFTSHAQHQIVLWVSNLWPRGSCLLWRH